MTPSHKDEAIMALDTALADLDEVELGGLVKAQIRASVQYAREQIVLVQELKRPRKPKAG